VAGAEEKGRRGIRRRGDEAYAARGAGSRSIARSSIGRLTSAAKMPSAIEIS